MLAVIMGRAELLLERGLNAGIADDLRAIILAADDAAAMLKRLRRGVPQRDREEEAAVNLRRAAEAVGLLIRPPMTGKWGLPAAGGGPRWDFTWDVPADLHTSVPGQVMREVLSNLLVNALEVMPTGGNIRLDAMADPARVRVTVADDGPGLDNETARRIFEPGFTSREGDFRGIGLAGSRQLLKCFDGRLELAAGQEPGAAFVLDLPRAAAPPTGSAEPVASAAAAAAGLDVLVVDDETGVREMLTDVLTALGCRVTAARDATEGLEAFGRGGFDLALLDQTLPGRSGLDLAGALRERDPHLVVVLVSGWGQEEVLAGADPAVVDLTAYKPLPWNRIREILAQATGIHQQRKDQKG